ncbi:CRISPR-associated protein Csx11 [candidate division WS5 bacterium]|uniref:CRISPR-associated protein Csx11 n=1 Tax=candidate division WS5 bacterium TaxID=2093353 RepID=A0A419DDV0_9BACT|nr:MAG: CRISPR-associated protein Csx11 [candidate division WS5 bacterium]
MISKLQGNKNQILFIELCGLLHDIGKLSKAFLEYRQKWQDFIDLPDPHVDKFLDSDKNEPFLSLIPKEFSTKKTIELINSGFKETDFSIKKAVHEHVDKRSTGDIMLLLRVADGIDSAIDRNNPLWSAEQKTGNIYKSNVFGYESGRIITFESQEKARQELYISLSRMLPDYFKNTGFGCTDRSNILNEIKKAFEQGLSDTTRPQNDTTLWEHSYAVASILKAITVHNLFHDDPAEKICKREDVRFGILGIGWNGMRFMSYGQKIGDIVGRKNVIDRVKKALSELIEYDYPIGNEIYSDDDGIYFIVPMNLKQYQDIWESVEKQIYLIASDISCGELQPFIEIEPETRFITNMVKVINELRKSRAAFFNSSTEHFKFVKESLSDHWNNTVNKTVCPICRLRPVEKVDEKKKACKICKERRNQDDYQESSESKNRETLFIDESVDGNKRAALIVARFGLDKWLDGTMVRSMFVTEAKGIEKEIENLGKVKQFVNEEVTKKKMLQSCFEVNYNRIVDDINSFSKKDMASRAKCIAFLYDRRQNLDENKINVNEIFDKWKRIRASVAEEIEELPISCLDILLYNILCAKTPTPSTVLDIWETTKEFFEEIPRMIFEAFFSEKNRLLLQTDKADLNYRKYRGTLDAEVSFEDGSNKKIEILLINNSNIEVVNEIFPNSKEWANAKINIVDDRLQLTITVTSPSKGSLFLPYRTITATPNLFMTIVPADRAVEISALIYQKYIEHFGKVMGRLPFNIGNIFFGNKMPMFVVLDAGKRMIANFDSLAKEPEKFILSRDKTLTSSNCNFHLKWAMKNKLDKTLTWKLPYKLGNCADDYHHPYFIIDTTEDLSSERSTFFKTIAGSVVHFTEIEKGDVLSVHPNYYDFEFLDSNARRHDITLDGNDRRRSNVADFNSKPFLLDELSQKVMCLWDDILQGKQLKGITDTKLRNLQSLWLTKYQEWVVPDNGNKDKWKNLVACSVEKEFPQIDSEQYSLLMETLDNGVFFDTLELYLGILKERIDDKNKGGN